MSPEARPTPELVLDLDAVERNLRDMAERCERLGVRLRPHIKSHKCLEIARLQRDLGGAGITVSTLEEARAFAEHGFDDITWAFPLIVGRIDEVAELADRVSLGVVVDSEPAIEAAGGLPVRVWLKVDCGYGRAGVDPASDRALRLAERLHESSVDFEGILSHSGHAYGGESAERIRGIAEAERAVMVEFGDRLRDRGIEVRSISVGSTPAMTQVRDLTGVTEARPGNYALFDYTQATLGSCGIEDCAVSVVASVVSSRPDSGKCVIDAGALALSKDLGPDDPPHYGRLFASPDSPRLGEGRVISVSQEHGMVNLPLEVGELVRILPNHSCLTVAQFDAFQVTRQGEFVDVWKIWRLR